MQEPEYCSLSILKEATYSEFIPYLESLPKTLVFVVSKHYDSVRNCPFCVERDLKYLYQSQADKITERD